MRRAWLLCFLVVGCKTVSNESRPTTAVSAQPPTPSASVAIADAAPPPETALAWGTRPPTTGELFPVIDGMCIHAEVWPTKGSAMLSWGNGYGSGSRVGTATWARFVDDGLDRAPDLMHATDKATQDELTSGDPYHVLGTWPGPMLLSIDNPSGRMRSYDTVWLRDDKGWNVLGSYHEAGEPNYSYPILFKGWAISSRSQPKSGPNDYDNWTPSLVKAWPVDKGAAPIAKLETLGRAGFRIRDFEASDTTLYARGWSDGPAGKSPTPVMRWLTDGKTGEVPIADDTSVFGTTSTAMFLGFSFKTVQKLEDGKLTPLPLKLQSGEQVSTGRVAANGDLWLRTSKNRVLIVHGDAVTETTLPVASGPTPHEDTQHSPTVGGGLAGVDLDDPYAIGNGELFHWVNGQWNAVPMPKPPFATQGKYAAQSLTMPARGDLFVNAGYGEKGVGWKTSERYRAILRTKRPRETLRCNEPEGGSTSSNGHGFMSFPPIADDACTTPVAILVRLAWNSTWAGKWIFKYDPKSDYPSVRAAIKATPSLGASVDLIEVESGDQRYLAAPVPSVAAGKELALAVVKNVKDEFLEIRPEIVCGTAKAARTIHVDVATGKPVTAP